MANDSKDYNIPFGINSTDFFKELNAMDGGLERLEANAVSANKTLQGAFNSSTQAGQKLNDAIQSDGRAIQILRDQAQKFGTNIAEALSGKGIGEQFKTKVDELKKKLGSLTNTAVGVNVTIDDQKLVMLEGEIKKAANATEEFNTVIAFAKEQLANMEPGGQGFTQLQNQIKDAETLVERLNQAVMNTGQAATIVTGEFERLFGNPGEFLTQSELLQLDEALEKSETDAQALTAQVTALSTKLKTLDPGSAKFLQFQEAVDAGNRALTEMGAETVQFAAAETQTETRTTSLRAQLRGMREELAALEIAGQTGTQRFEQLSIQAGELADQVGDTGQRIRVLASDTKYLDAGIQAVTGLTGAFTAGQGAIALFGDENEKSAKIIQKVTGALAILQGIQALANALNKDSALSILLLSSIRGQDAAAAGVEAAAATAAATATVAGVEATAAAELTAAAASDALAAGETIAATAADTLAVAEGTVTVATEAATAATTGFTAALLLNPITLIVTAIVLATAAIIQFASATDKAEEATDRLNLALKSENDLFDDTIKNTQRLTDLRVAAANARGAKDSEISQIEQTGLKNSLKAQQDYSRQLLDNMKKLEEIREKDGLDEKKYIEERDKLAEQYSASRGAETDYLAKLDVEEINQISKANREKVELNQAFIQEENANYSERKKTQGLILQSIKDIRDEELKTITNADIKERQQIKNAGADRVQAIKEQIQEMRRQIISNGQEISLLNQQISVGAVDPAVAAKRISDLNEQNGAYVGAIKAAGKNIIAVQKSTSKQLELQQKETDRKRIELRLAVNVAETEAQADGFKKDLDLLSLQHQQQQAQIKEQYKDEAELRDRLLVANNDAYALKVKKLTYENGLKLIDQETQLNELQLETAGHFALDNISQQKALQVELLKVRLKGAQDRLEALKDDGTNESKIAIEQQKKLIADLKKQLGLATKDAGEYSIFKLFGLDKLNDAQKDSLLKFTQIAGQAINSFTDLMVSQYDRQIDAKQKVIDATQSQIDDMERQLDKEKNLMDGGFANDYENVQRKIALKKKEKDDEIKQQQELIKKRQAAQKAQLAIDSAAEASGLIVSAVNIFKGFTAAFPVIGVPLAIAAIGLMTGAFVAAKVKAFQAVNDASNQAEASFGEGGFIDGKSHAQGGQRYRSIDGTGRVIELEAHEYVVKKSVAQEHGEFLEALNNDRMTDQHLADFLAGMGISLSPSAPEKAVKEIGRRNKAESAAVIKIDSGGDELKDIKELVAYLVERKKDDPVSWETPGKLHVKKGTKTINYEKA